MVMMPPGVYGSGTGAAGAGAAAIGGRLLTSSLDGTLRLWDVSADLMSLEVCLCPCVSFVGIGRTKRLTNDNTSVLQRDNTTRTRFLINVVCDAACSLCAALHTAAAADVHYSCRAYQGSWSSCFWFTVYDTR